MYNNNNNNNDNNDKLFFSIFRNIYLKNLIFQHVKMFILVDKITTQPDKKYFNNGSFTNYNTKFKEFTIRSLLNFENRSYIKNLTIKSLSLFNNNNLNHINNNNNVVIVNNSTTTLSSSSNNNSTTITNKINTIIEEDYLNLPIGLIGEFVENLEIEKEGLVLMKNVIPSSVKSLKLIGNIFLMPGCIPSSVKTLIICNSKQMIIPGVIPDSVVDLKLLNSEQPLIQGSIPSSIVNLEFEVRNQMSCIAGILPSPSKLKKIKFGNTFNCQLIPGFIPQDAAHLEEIDFSFCKGEFNQPLLPNAIPNSVKVIYMSYNFNQPLIKGSLPSSLQELYLCGQFDQPLTVESIPNELKTLDLGLNFNQTLVPGALPNSLIELGMSTCYDKPILQGSLPINLKSIEFSGDYKQIIENGAIPPFCTLIQNNQTISNFE